jgi:hypothetical protein
MPKVPVPATPVNRIARPNRALSLVRRGALIAALVAALSLTTGAGIGPDSSQAELMMYSLGSALAVIMAIRIVIKLFVYIVQTAAVLAVFGVLFVLGNAVVNAVSGS